VLCLLGKHDKPSLQALELLDVEIAEHDKFHQGERDIHDDAKLRSEREPHNQTTINVDSPTQEQHRVPRFNQVMGKDVGSLKHWFVPKVVGCWVYGFMLLHFIVMPNVYGGANLTCTVVYLMLLKLANSDRPIGRHFHLQLDNTTGENKNMIVIAFVAWLMQIHTFHHARIFFLTKGNTKTQLDQSFGTYIRQLQYHCFLTLGSLVLFMYRATLGKYVGVQPPQYLYCIWDWEKYLEPFIEPISGYATAGDFSGMHIFDFSLTRDGDVQLHMKQSFQSSVASPEGPGYIVLKGMPEGAPPLQRLKTPLEWHKSEVQQSTQVASKYFCRLGDQQRIADVVAEWDDLFKQMKDDVSQLAPEQRLTFQFPHRSNGPADMVDISNGRARLHPDDLPQAHREMLERILYRPSDVEPPRVDPTFGGERTFADRERERAQLREELRRKEGPSATNPPIYRQEYLILQLEGRREPTLHRVMSSATDGFAGRQSIDLKLTEYEPFGAPGESADYFSCFRPRPNPEYQRQRHAPEYICSRLQSRSTILVNNVATMGKGLSLRICVDSLKMLAEQSASFQMPSELPASHAPRTSQNSDAASKGRGSASGKKREIKPLTHAEASALTIGLTASEVMARRFYFAKAPWTIANISRTIGGGGGDLAHRAVLVEVLESEVYDSFALSDFEQLSRSAVSLLRKEVSPSIRLSTWDAGGAPNSCFKDSRVIQIYAASEADLRGCMKLLITPAEEMFIEFVAVDTGHRRERICTGMFDFATWRFQASLLVLRLEITNSAAHAAYQCVGFEGPITLSNRNPGHGYMYMTATPADVRRQVHAMLSETSLQSDVEIGFKEVGAVHSSQPSALNFRTRLWQPMRLISGQHGPKYVPHLTDGSRTILCISCVYLLPINVRLLKHEQDQVELTAVTRADLKVMCEAHPRQLIRKPTCAQSTVDDHSGLDDWQLHSSDAASQPGEVATTLPGR